MTSRVLFLGPGRRHFPAHRGAVLQTWTMSDSPRTEVTPEAHHQYGGEPVVDVRDLRVRFGSVEAVRGIDLRAYAGQATALLGRNGAGKSTTMRVLAGVIPPSGGEVRLAGY